MSSPTRPPTQSKKDEQLPSSNQQPGSASGSHAGSVSGGRPPTLGPVPSSSSGLSQHFKNQRAPGSNSSVSRKPGKPGSCTQRGRGLSTTGSHSSPPPSQSSGLSASYAEQLKALQAQATAQLKELAAQPPLNKQNS